MKERKRSGLVILVVILAVILCLLVGLLFALPGILEETAPTTEPTVETTVATEPPTTAPTEPPLVWEQGYVAAMEPEIALADETGSQLASLIRGSQVEYALTPEGTTLVRFGETEGYLPEEATLVSEPELVLCGPRGAERGAERQWP